MKPNIIIVMTGQQRADLRHAAGYETDTMPFLDSGSKEGVDFDLAYTPNPTCMPARVKQELMITVLMLCILRIYWMY